MSAIELTMTDVLLARDELHAWLRAHDLEPTETAPGVVIRDDEVTAKVWLRNADGHRYVTEDGLDAAHEIVTVPQLQPVPWGLGTVIP